MRSPRGEARAVLEGDMSFAELIQDAALCGDATRLDVAAATRLGRAFGTALRRRSSGGTQTVVLARVGQGNELALRDGLVRGLVLAGHHVRDLGQADDALLGFAVAELGAAGAVLASGQDGTLCLRFWLGQRALNGEALAELAALADGEDFAAGEGSLSIVDVRGAFRAQGRGDGA